MEAPKNATAAKKRARSKSPYYVQPSKGGQFTVLHRPCGNRISPKVCGVMPSRAHALALVRQLERAESAVDDLFLEATDDGIEALEAVLQACCQSVLSRDLPPAPSGEAGGRPRRNAQGGGGAGGGSRRRRGRGRPGPRRSSGE